jgi:hypothetical protein
MREMSRRRRRALSLFLDIIYGGFCGRCHSHQCVHGGRNSRSKVQRDGHARDVAKGRKVKKKKSASIESTIFFTFSCSIKSPVPFPVPLHRSFHPSKENENRPDVGQAPVAVAKVASMKRNHRRRRQGRRRRRRRGAMKVVENMTIHTNQHAVADGGSELEGTAENGATTALLSAAKSAHGFLP